MTALAVSPAWHWARRNLFLKPFDTVLTLVVGTLLTWTLWSFFSWVFGVAQWGVVLGSMKVLMTGIFPVDELWRAKVAGALLLVLLGFAFTSAKPAPQRPMVRPLAVLAVAVVVGTIFGGLVWILPGAAGGLAAWIAGSRSAAIARHIGWVCLGVVALVLAVLAPVSSTMWGGLLLSMLLTLTAGLLTVPLGILLAFGRQSKVASIRILAAGYIELIRAVPLILVVYLVWISVPLLWPSSNLSDVIRGLIGFVVFYSAYAAEYVRAGLQAVPRGQVEAAQALGYSGFDIKRLVVLPQAMRVAIPGLVGNTLDIFNYAPLVFIIGLTDFLRAGQMILADPANSDKALEVYVFLFATYYAIGSVITYLARRIETRVSRRG
jgi:general L-amino acid transport system permease protein